MATSTWLHHLLEVPLLTLVSFHCLLRATEAKHLRWWDVQILDVPMPARCEKVSGIVNISKITGHAAQQRMLLDCFEIGQMIAAITYLSQQFGLLLHGLPKKRASLPCGTSLRQIPPPTPYNHHIDAALPTPSRLSEHLPSLLNNVAQKT